MPLFRAKYAAKIPQDDLPPTEDVMEVCKDFYLPCWQCALCGEYSTEPLCLHNTVICDECADAIMNHYHYARSGRFLTWRNPEPEPGPDDPRKPIHHGMRRRIYERDAYRCRYCGSYHDLSIDHVIPVSRGGSHTDDNMVTCCRKCNSRKLDRTPEEAGMILHESQK